MDWRTWLTAARLAAFRRAAQRVGMVLGLGLLALQLLQTAQSLAGRAISVASPEAMGLSLGLAVVAIGVQMAAWRRLMRTLAVPLTHREVMRGYILSFLPRYIPGAVWGYLSRNEWLAQSHRVRYGLANLASILEMAMILLAGLWLIAFHFLTVRGGLAVWLGAAALFGLAALVPWGLQVTLRQRWPAALDSEPAPVGWADGVVLLGLYAVFWLCHGATVLGLARAVQPIAGWDLLTYTASYAAAWWVGFLIVIVPAGVGVREWVLASSLVTLAGLPPHLSGLVALMARLATVMSEGLWVVAGVALSVLQGRQAPDHDHKIS